MKAEPKMSVEVVGDRTRLTLTMQDGRLMAVEQPTADFDEAAARVELACWADERIFAKFAVKNLAARL